MSYNVKTRTKEQMFKNFKQENIPDLPTRISECTILLLFYLYFLEDVTDRLSELLLVFLSINELYFTQCPNFCGIKFYLIRYDLSIVASSSWTSHLPDIVSQGSFSPLWYHTAPLSGYILKLSVSPCAPMLFSRSLPSTCDVRIITLLLQTL